MVWAFLGFSFVNSVPPHLKKAVAAEMALHELDMRRAITKCLFVAVHGYESTSGTITRT